jgi:hypothetical protein
VITSTRGREIRPGWLRGYQRAWLSSDLFAGLIVWGLTTGDAVSSQYTPRFEFTGGRIVKVVFDVAEDAYVDVERELVAAIARE